jgi:acetyl esterase
MAVKTQCIVINCDYRKCPETLFPAPVFDAYACLKYVIKHASALKIDKNRITMVGESAGACILLGVA